MATATVETRAGRESAAMAFFGSWAIIGLFVDGWSHQANKPETFFTPWHLMLYSGVGAAVLWFAIDGRRHAGLAPVAADRLASLGLAAFIIGGVGDGIWHEVVGIEVDLEALLSPTHLLLMTGGLFMLSGPVRWAIGGESTLPDNPTFVRFLPVAVALTLCASLATFFTMYLGAQWPVAWDTGGEIEQARGVASVLVRNLLVMAPLLLARARWRLPMGTCTLLLGANAVLMAALEGFDFPELIVPFVIAGVVADLLGERMSDAAFSIVVPLVLWSTYFVAHEAGYEVAWTPELWAGSIFLATISSYAMGGLLRVGGRPPAPAGRGA